MRYAATIAYNGTTYRGFQRQARGPSVQQTIEEVIAQLVGSETTVRGAGRTDAGVHAAGQVIAFDVDWSHGPDALKSAINANLPADVVFKDVRCIYPGFDPRRHAVGRTYQYRLYVSEVRDPLRNNLAWNVPLLPKPGLMKRAAKVIVGTHDFTSFGLPPGHGTNGVRTVTRATWENAGTEAIFTITANAFLFRMVRTLVGTMVKVGQGGMTVDEFRAILSARKRGLAAAPAPACGLTLLEVLY